MPGDALQLVHRRYVDLVDDRADTPCTQRIAERFHRRVDSRMDLVHLPDLFGQRHPADIEIVTRIKSPTFIGGVRTERTAIITGSGGIIKTSTSTRTSTITITKLHIG